jgi:hypothetical protein
VSKIRGARYVLCAIGAAAACRGGGEIDPARCAEVDGSVPADVRVDRLAGDHLLVMVSTSGEREGRRAAGALELVPHDSASRYVVRPGVAVDSSATIPLFGATDISIEDVGAVRLGDLGSLDPRSPGVAVLEQRRPGAGSPLDLVVRLGSLANRRDIQRFDGGYTALTVRWLEDDAFGGSWESGVSGPVAGGYFCVYRKVSE